MEQVAAVIPAYNEAGRIGNVLTAVSAVREIGEIIVVSDGSTDKTADEARKVGDKVRVLELPSNQGKGAALLAGVRATTASILVLLDADLVGLRPAHVESLLRPVLVDGAFMAVAVFAQGRLATDLAQKIAPFLSGQRAVKRELLESIPELNVSRFGVEVALTQYVHEMDIPVVRVPWYDVTHVMKEEKLGLAKGFSARLKMYQEIISSLKLPRGRHDE
ncbi:MAG: glycosyltransferase family 2 protein [Firmicutes bacterium]|jgi:glycosyltransferase involved in cell wall biosynthesis|nr:glycosyltransferase family 2 protein [Bacillota bacterium]